MRNRKMLEKALAVTMLAGSMLPSMAFADGETVDLGTRDNPKKIESTKNNNKVEKDTSTDKTSSNDSGKVLGERKLPEREKKEEKEEAAPIGDKKESQKKSTKDSTKKKKKKEKKEDVEIIETPEPLKNNDGIDFTNDESPTNSNEYDELAGGNTDDVNWESFNFGYDMNVNPNTSTGYSGEFTSYDPNIPFSNRTGSSGSGTEIVNPNDFNMDITEGSIVSDVDDSTEIAEMPSLFDTLKLYISEDNKQELPEKVETVKFNLNPQSDNAKLYDLGIPADTTEKELVAETLRQASILNGGRFVEDKDNLLLYKGNKIKVFPRTTPLKDLLAFFDDSKFVIEQDATRIGGKFTTADYLEIMGKLNIKVNGKDLVLTTNPQVVDGIVLVPVRDVAVALGAKVEWNQQTKIAKVTKGNTVIMLNDKNEIARQNGVGYRLSASPEVSPEKRMLASISILVKNLDANMNWDAHANSLIIETNEYTKEREKQENNANAKADEERQDSSMQGTKFKTPRDLTGTPAEDANKDDNKAAQPTQSVPETPKTSEVKVDKEVKKESPEKTGAPTKKETKDSKEGAKKSKFNPFSFLKKK